MITNIFILDQIVGYNIYGNIILQKNISLWFFHLDHNLGDNDDNIFYFYFYFKDQSRAISGLFPNELVEQWISCVIANIWFLNTQHRHIKYGFNFI